MREHLVILVCLIWSLLEHSVFKKLNITMALSKGVLSMEHLVLGDSVLTISRDKGLIYTEVGCFRKPNSSKSIGNVDMLSNSETANYVSSFLAGLIALQMQMAFS